jgi:hypothetical protein
LSIKKKFFLGHDETTEGTPPDTGIFGGHASKIGARPRGALAKSAPIFSAFSLGSHCGLWTKIQKFDVPFKVVFDKNSGRISAMKKSIEWNQKKIFDFLGPRVENRRAA